MVKALTSFTIMPWTWVPNLPGETRPYFGESADKLHYNAMNMGSKLPDEARLYIGESTDKLHYKVQRHEQRTAAAVSPSEKNT